MYIRSLKLLSVVGIVVALAGCWSSDESPSNRGSTPVGGASLVVINVLDANMYADCHIKGSIHVPFEEIEAYAQRLGSGVKVVTYCSNYSCSASAAAARMFKEAGIDDVRAYEGGMAEWYQKDLPHEGPAQLEYLKEEGQPGETEEDITTISAEELYALMQQEGLL